jgi:hypothetical protein
VVCSRVREPQEALSAATIALEISSRNARVAALQDRWTGCAPASSCSPTSGARTWPNCPGAPAGCRCATPGARLRSAGDPHRPRRGLVAELRGHERQAAEELGQWKTGVGERNSPDEPPGPFWLGIEFACFRDDFGQASGKVIDSNGSEPPPTSSTQLGRTDLPVCPCEHREPFYGPNPASRPVLRSWVGTRSFSFASRLRLAHTGACSLASAPP